jgi:hypothetical protein
MVTKSVFSESPLGLFDFGHPKNVQNRFLESLSHTKKHVFFHDFYFQFAGVKNPFKSFDK